MDEGNAAAIATDCNLSGCNYTSYFVLYDHLTALGATQLTPAPGGYEAFYVSTYARHGSRSMLQAEQYDNPIRVLTDAARRHQLSPRGNTLLQRLTLLRRLCPNEQLGALTDVGRRQHRALATRMWNNFPSVFDDEAQIIAQSSKSERCILSMQEACDVLSSLSHADIEQVCGKADMQQRLAGAYSSEEMKEVKEKYKAYHAEDQAAHVPFLSFCDTLFRTTTWTTDEQLRTFCTDVFHLAQNMQSHDLGLELWEFFTADEVAALSAIDNRYWYRRFGASPVTGSIMPQRSRPQLGDFIAAADSVVQRPNWHGAHLRFGHDICLLPLACLMQLGTCGAVVEEDNIDALDALWRCQEIFPMAGNIQLVFYRRQTGGGDVLVKALLNEREVTLPATPVSAPYYRWADVREQWMKEMEE